VIRHIHGLYAILDPSLLDPGRVPEVAAVLIEAGTGTVQLRDKRGSDRETLVLARRLADLCNSKGALFVVNDRPDIAAASGASGVHLGQDDLPVDAARRILPAGAVVGISTHSPKQAAEAEAAGADYIGFGPVFPTSTKADPDPVVGLQGLSRVAEAAHIPVVAIGGIDWERAAQIADAGASACALVSALAKSADPGADAATVNALFAKRKRP